MGSFLPSEIARLVLGYLEEQGCMRSYDEFLNGCRHLEECRGRGFFTRIMGLSLSDILDEYCAIHSFIMEVNMGEEFKSKVLKCQSLLEKVKLFVKSSDLNVGVSEVTNIEKHSKSNTTLGRPSKVHNFHKPKRHIRSNSCDSIMTVKTEQSCTTYRGSPEPRDENVSMYDRGRKHCEMHGITRSMESLAEATSLADLPGNKRYTRCSCSKAYESTSKDRWNNKSTHNSTSKNHSHISKPSCSTSRQSIVQVFRDSFNKSIDKALRGKLDMDEVEFRKALGLMKSSDVPDRGTTKTPLKGKSSNKRHIGPTKKMPHMSETFPSESFNVTTITNALLDCTELHEKLAENINKIYNLSSNKILEEESLQKPIESTNEDTLMPKEGATSEEPVTPEEEIPQLDAVIKSIVEKTEQDPIFDQLVNEVLAASVESTTGSDSDIISRPGTSTPEKSSYSQMNESSPSHSWKIHDKNKQYIDDKISRQHCNFRKPQSIHNDRLRSHYPISPHKNDFYNKSQYSSRSKKYPRYPRGGKRMDLLRESYRNSYGTEDADSFAAPSTKSNSPIEPITSPKESPTKADPRVIILSNEVVQTNLMTKPPLTITKPQEEVFGQNVPLNTDRPMEVSSQPSLKETPSEILPGQMVGANIDNHLPTRPNSCQIPQTVTLIRNFSDPRLQTGISTINKPFVTSGPSPVVLKTISSFEGSKLPSSQMQATNVNPPVSICLVSVPNEMQQTTTFSDITFRYQQCNQMNNQNFMGDVSKLRNYRRNIVSGKPPDIVISNGQITTTKVDDIKTNYFTEADIMKMPTIIMLPQESLESHVAGTSFVPAMNPSVNKLNIHNNTQNIPSNNLVLTGALPMQNEQSSQNIGVVSNTANKKRPSRRKSAPGTKKPTNKSTTELPKLINATQPMPVKTLQDMISVLDLERQNNKSTRIDLRLLIPEQVDKIQTAPLEKMSSLSSTVDSGLGNKSGLESLSQSKPSTSGDTLSIQSYVSSEDDRFVIDEGQKPVSVNTVSDLSNVKQSVSSEICLTSERVSETIVIPDSVSHNIKDLDAMDTRRKTPELKTNQKVSASTPRRGLSHVRVLDFNTPPKISEPRKANSSPKLSYRGRSSDMSEMARRSQVKAVKSQLFPTIPEKPKECKVLKPKTPDCKNIEQEAQTTELTVSGVWDQVQGMGQIIKNDEESKDGKNSASKKEKTVFKPSENKESDKDSKCDSATEENLSIQKKATIDEEDKKSANELAAAEWARIRSMSKKCWDQEMRAMLSTSDCSSAAKPKPKPKKRKKKNSPVKVEEEMSKSIEDDARLLENALNKSTPAKQTNGEVDQAKDEDLKASTILVIESKDSFIPIVDLGSEEVKDIAEEQLDQHHNTSQTVSTPCVDKSKDGHVSNKDYLLQVKLFRDSVREQSVETCKFTSYSNTLTNEVDNSVKKQKRNPKTKNSVKVKMGSKNEEHDDDIIELSDQNTESSSAFNHNKGLSPSKEIENEAVPKYSDMAGPWTADQSLAKNLLKPVEVEPPVPAVKITPNMPKEHDFNPLSAKCNLASLLETPFKTGIMDLHLDTPKFISPIFNNCSLSSIKLLDMPTPNFSFFIESGTTPRDKIKDGLTPGSYSSRPTDYSSSSSYYKPDEIEFNLDLAKKASVKPLPTVIEEETNTSTNENVSQRVLRPRRNPTVYYPNAQQTKSNSQNISKNSSVDKSHELDSSLKSKTLKENVSHLSVKENIPTKCTEESLISSKEPNETSKGKIKSKDSESKNVNCKNTSKKSVCNEDRLKTDNDSRSSFCSTCSSSSSESSDSDKPLKSLKTFPTSTPKPKDDTLKKIDKNITSPTQNARRQLEEKRRRVLSKLKNVTPKKKFATPKAKISFTSKKSFSKINKNKKSKLKLRNSSKKLIRSRSSTETEKQSVTVKKETPVDKTQSQVSVPASSKSRRKSSTPRKLQNVLAGLTNVLLPIPTGIANSASSSSGVNDSTKLNVSSQNTSNNTSIEAKNNDSSINSLGKRESPQGRTPEKIFIKSNNDVLNAVMLVEKEPAILKENEIQASSSVTLLQDINKADYCGNLSAESESDRTQETDKLDTVVDIKALANDDDYVTLHLSSDEAEVDVCNKSITLSIQDKNENDSYDISQIREYIANSSDEKTAFQKNLEKEGFDEISAKTIERDLTDINISVEEIFATKASDVPKASVPVVEPDQVLDRCVSLDELFAEKKVLESEVIKEQKTTVKNRERTSSNQSVNSGVSETRSIKSTNDVIEKESNEVKCEDDDEIDGNINRSDDDIKINENTNESVTQNEIDSEKNTSPPPKNSPKKFIDTVKSPKTCHKSSRYRPMDKKHLKKTLNKSSPNKINLKSPMKNSSSKRISLKLYIERKRLQEGKNKIIDSDNKHESSDGKNKRIDSDNKHESSDGKNKRIDSDNKHESSDGKNKRIDSDNKHESSDGKNKRIDSDNKHESSDGKNKRIDCDNKHESSDGKNKRIDSDNKHESSDGKNKRIDSDNKHESSDGKNKRIDCDNKHESSDGKNKRIDSDNKHESSDGKNKIIDSDNKHESSDGKNKRIDSDNKHESSDGKNKRIDSVNKHESSDGKNDNVDQVNSSECEVDTNSLLLEQRLHIMEPLLAEIEADLDLKNTILETPVVEESIKSPSKTMCLPDPVSNPPEEKLVNWTKKTVHEIDVEATLVLWEKGENNDIISMNWGGPKSKRKPKTGSTIDINTLELKVTVFNSVRECEDLRTIRTTEPVDLIMLDPNRNLRLRIMRQERSLLKQQRMKSLENEGKSKKKAPLDLLFEEMANSQDTVQSPLDNIYESEDEKVLEKENMEKIIAETDSAVRSILPEDDPLRNAFFHTPIKYSFDPNNSTAHVDAVCDTLTKAIIEDKTSDRLDDDESSQEVETPKKEFIDDDLMNFAVTSCRDDNLTSVYQTFQDVSVKEKRKRDDEPEESDCSNLKKIKTLDPQTLLKQIDIESVLSKLHGPK